MVRIHAVQSFRFPIFTWTRIKCNHDSIAAKPLVRERGTLEHNILCITIFKYRLFSHKLFTFSINYLLIHEHGNGIFQKLPCTRCLGSMSYVSQSSIIIHKPCETRVLYIIYLRYSIKSYKSYQSNRYFLVNIVSL